MGSAWNSYQKPAHISFTSFNGFLTLVSIDIVVEFKAHL